MLRELIGWDVVWKFQKYVLGYLVFGVGGMLCYLVLKGVGPYSWLINYGIGMVVGMLLSGIKRRYSRPGA